MATTMTTVNHSTFAVEYLQASSAVLDALAKIGGARLDLLGVAKLHIDRALRATDDLQETDLANALLQQIVKLQREEQPGRSF